MITAYVRRGAGVAVLCVGLGVFAGCGLISSDVTNFDLTLPDKKFTIDTKGWQVDPNGASWYLGQSCPMSDVCNAAVEMACMTGCSGICNASHTCDLQLDISLRQLIDLLAEKPELKTIDDQPVIKVTVDSVTYDVSSNDLNVDTPELTVYVAPMSSTRISDPQVKAIGTIASVPAGWKTEQSEPIMFTATGKADLVNVMSQYMTPFNVLVGSSLLITKDQALPMGKLEAVVHIRGHAGI